MLEALELEETQTVVFAGEITNTIWARLFNHVEELRQTPHSVTRSRQRESKNGQKGTQRGGYTTAQLEQPCVT